MPWPIVATVPTIATEISAAIRPYSIAVAPRRSTRKRPRLRAAAPRRNPNEVIARPPVLCLVVSWRSPSQQRRQMGNQRHVGRRHRILLETVGPYPGEPLAFPGRHGALPAAAHIERHQQVEIRIAVAGESQRRQTGLLDHDAQLLLELANKRLFRPFALLDLAAGEFP